MFNIFLTQNSGILGPIARGLGWILNQIFEFLAYFGIQNAGLTIILFTFIVNALMIPLTIKQQKFGKLSAKMNPEITKVTSKYKGKKDEVSMRKQQAETQAIYQKYGANPTSGCLPMLITLPIMFALYRVIYNIPAYVDSIKVLYQDIAKSIQGIDHISIMTEMAEKFPTLKIKDWDITSSVPINNLIDIMAQFKSNNWEELINKFPTISNVIVENQEKIVHVNTFIGGLNIADTPKLTVPISLLIPVLAVATQFLQTRMMALPATGGDNNSTAATMKTMNNVMPLVSGGFCMVLPIGVGLYWIAGSVFRIVQQFFVNKYMDTIDIDALIEKNAEKAKNKKAKVGNSIESKVNEVAKTRTSSIKENSSINSYKNNSNENSNTKKGDDYYEPGSISSIANMLKNKKNMDKGDK